MSRPFPLALLTAAAILTASDLAAAAPKRSAALPAKADSLPAKPQTTYRPDMSPAEAGAKLVQALIAGDSLEHIAPFIEDSVVAAITPEVIADFGNQAGWLANFLGDALQLFAEGSRTYPDGTYEYFREYRFANEADQKNPLVLVQVQFADSLTNKASGAFVKNFLLARQGEQRLAGAQTWKIAGKNREIRSVSLQDLETAYLLFIGVDDEDTVSLEIRDSALPRVVPIVREALARGWLDSAYKARPDTTKPLLDEIGVLFVRIDRHLGYTHFRHAARPEEYALPEKRKKAGVKKNGK